MGSSTLLAWGACLLIAGFHPGDRGSIHQDCSFELPGTGFASFFRDVDGDGRSELITTLRSTRSGRREIHVRFLDREDRYPAQPSRTVEVLPDVVTWALADVRSEPGDELVFLTRTGAFSYSLTKEGYQGNIQRMLRANMLFDVPDPKAFPRWKYVVPVPGGDLLLLPLQEGFSVWQPSAERGGDGFPYELAAQLPATIDRDTRPGRHRRNREESGTIRIGVDAAYELPLLPEEPPTSGTLLNVNIGYGAPALADVDGDRRLDMLFLEEKVLRIHTLGTDPAAATEVELPAYLKMGEEDIDVDITPVDVDGDGDVDLMVRIAPDSDGLGNRTLDLLVLRNHGGQLLPAKPDQVLRFEAAEIRFRVIDANGDGRPDLCVRKFEMPSVMEVTTGLEFRSSTLVYFGKAKGPRGPAFDRKPAVKEQQVFDAESLGQALGRKRLGLDASGDGLADEVEVGLNGEIEIRRLRKESSFFSGDTWKLESTPWRSFDALGNIGDLTVADVNGDGIADLLSSGEDSVAVLVSRPRAK